MNPLSSFACKTVERDATREEWKEEKVWDCVHVYEDAYMCMCKRTLLSEHMSAAAAGSENQCEHTQMCLNLIRPDE